jgi:hypothetical protein
MIWICVLVGGVCLVVGFFLGFGAGHDTSSETARKEEKQQERDQQAADRDEWFSRVQKRIGKECPRCDAVLKDIDFERDEEDRGLSIRIHDLAKCPKCEHTIDRFTTYIY